MAIRIDVHPAGETWCTRHVRTHDRSYAATFHADLNRVGRILLLPRKRSPISIPGPAEWSVGPVPVSLPSVSHWSIGFKPSICCDQITSVYWVPYIQHVISTFNTCSGGPTTARSLTNTDGGYHLGDSALPQHSPRPSQADESSFPWFPRPVSN